jgi:hypothetical protein
VRLFVPNKVRGYTTTTITTGGGGSSAPVSAPTIYKSHLNIGE